MIVLSLFDGMSCGQIALRDMGIPVTRYYASEIDKWAIQQTQLNFPGTVQLGDVRNVEARTLGILIYSLEEARANRSVLQASVLA